MKTKSRSLKPSWQGKQLLMIARLGRFAVVK